MNKYHDYPDYCLFDCSNEKTLKIQSRVNNLDIMNSQLNDKIYDNSVNYGCIYHDANYWGSCKRRNTE